MIYRKLGRLNVQYMRDAVYICRRAILYGSATSWACSHACTVGYSKYYIATVCLTTVASLLCIFPTGWYT